MANDTITITCESCNSYSATDIHHDDDGETIYLCEGCYHAVTEHGCGVHDAYAYECDGSDQ